MKNIIIIISFLFLSSPLFSDNSQISFIKKDHKDTGYFLSEIENISFIKGSSVNLMKIYYEKNKSETYQTSNIDSITFESINNIYRNLVIYDTEGNTNKYNLYDIDSIVYLMLTDPKITSISPASGNPGDTVSILGSGFGLSEKNCIVAFNSANAGEILNWNNWEIKLKVPEGTKSGNVSVSVYGKQSNEVEFFLPPAIELAKYLGGSGYDNLNSICESTDGGFILAGSTDSNDGDITANHGKSDAWIIKFNNDGDIIWQKTYGGSENDGASLICRASDEGYIIAGASGSTDGDLKWKTDKGIWIFKINDSGDILWQKIIKCDDSFGLESIKQTKDGGYVIAGSRSFSDYTKDDFWIIKLDKSCEKQWDTKYNSESFNFRDRAQDIQQTSDGGYIVIGNVETLGNVPYMHYWHIQVLKLAANGGIEWGENYGGSGNENGTAIALAGDKGYVLACEVQTKDGDIYKAYGGCDYWIIKLRENYYSSWNIEWQSTLGGSKDDYPYSLQATKDGGFIVAGYSASTDGDLQGTQKNGSAWVVKLNDKGKIQWQGTYNRPSKFIIQISDGSFIIAGTENADSQGVSGTHGKYDFSILKIKPQ